MEHRPDLQVPEELRANLDLAIDRAADQINGQRSAADDADDAERAS